jgi:transcriptional regulator with XRE-family HTH domain
MTRLLHERRRRGWSQLQLGYHASLQPSEISRIENGRLKPYPAQLERLARALGVDQAEALLENVQEPALSA